MPIFTDTSLSDYDRKAIHDFALTARDLLTAEARDLLEGVYGLKADGKLAPLNRLPNLENDLEGQETHRRLDHLLGDEVKGGLEPTEAVRKLVKEIAFTHLNRLVAFKMMEVRKLIRQVVGRGEDSNGFKFYLAAHPTDEALWKSGQNGVEQTYCRFLLWQSGEIAREVRVLFDPGNLASRLFPRHSALKSVLELLNNPALEKAWTSTETIGWVYQFFNEREKEEFRKQKGHKVERDIISVVTQIFTPRWIVRYLVENTLGRLWSDLHPDSRLITELHYMVQLDPIHSRELPTAEKLVRDITLLDPACGTMHFGLVAFDLFAEMYREELGRAGEPGWPVKSSVENIDDIPAAIVANNIFGIDIDLRAVQLSALTLYLKAKEHNKTAIINDSNLACADVLALNGDRLKAFLEEMDFQRPAYERLIRALWVRLRDATQLGSLLRLETEIKELIAEERYHFEKEGRQPDLFGERKRFESEAAQEEYWDVVTEQLLQAFDEFARRAAQSGSDETFFAGEAIKGMRLLDMMMRRYDCITMNPPYLDSRDYNDTLKSLMETAYPLGKRNLFAAFIERSLEFLSPSGRLGVLSGQSFMFLSSFEEFRKACLNSHVIECLAQFDYGLFTDARVDTVAFILRSEPRSSFREKSQGVYFRLVNGLEPGIKQIAFEHALSDGTNVYHTYQSDFSAIPGSPWVYWISSNIRDLFRTLLPMGDIAPSIHGTGTYDNFRFLRYWWEVGSANIGFNFKSWNDFLAGNKNYVPYMKGGSFKRWYGNQEIVLQLIHKGQSLIEFLNEKGDSIRGKDHIFHVGITYSFLTSGNFNSRISPGGFIFDVAGSSLFPDLVPLFLAILNSKFAAYILKLVNPTVNFQVGDLGRIPIPKDSSSTLENAVAQSIRLSKYNSMHDETTYDFVFLPRWASGLRDLSQIESALQELEAQIDHEVFNLYRISFEDQTTIEAELTRGSTGEKVSSENIQEDISEEELPNTMSELAVRWISYAVGVVLGRFLPGALGELGSAVYRRKDFSIGLLPEVSEDEFNILVGTPNSFAYINQENGRHVFSKEIEYALQGLADTDGIVVLDEGHPDDLPAKVETTLELMLGERSAAEVVYCLANEQRPDPAQRIELDRVALRKFLERDFFTKWHVKWYHKRPIYWLLQSPQKRYGLYIFHERITKDTLYLVQRDYVDVKINLTRQQLQDVHNQQRTQSDARSRRQIEKQADEIEKLLADLQEFSRRLKSITDRGYDPNIDDGVIINMAPLWEILPAWSKEPQKVWEKLENGEYDWSHLAMKYRPKHVKEKCKTNKSYAIAHGLA